MMYVFFGLVILVISFLIALLTLIREQRELERSRSIAEEPKLPPEPEPMVTQQQVESLPLADQPLDQVQTFQEPQRIQTAVEKEVPQESTQNSRDFEPYPWLPRHAEGIGNEPAVTQGSPNLVQTGAGTPNSNVSNLSKGGEFIIPRSIPDEK